jgi:hypothetical protein
MTLSFTTKWPERMGSKAGQQNYFIHYIWLGLPNFPHDHIKPIPEHILYLEGIHRPIEFYFQNLYAEKFAHYWPDPSIDATWNPERTESTSWRSIPKLHTIREDASNRWRAGMDIHFVINNRSKNRFQFAPVVKCVGVQDIEITDVTHISYPNDFSTKIHLTVSKDGWTETFTQAFSVKVDGIQLPPDKVHQLAINDGFDSVEDFFAYFDKDFKGKIVHWTT